MGGVDLSSDASTSAQFCNSVSYASFAYESFAALQEHRTISSSFIVTRKVSNKYHSQMKVTLKVIVALSWLKILHYFGKFKSQEFPQFLPGQRTSRDEEEDKKNASKLSHKLERAQHFFILCEIVTTFWNSSKSK